LADVRRKEIEGFQDTPKSPLIEQACDACIKDAEARELREPTLYKFRLLFRQMKEFAHTEGVVYVGNYQRALKTLFELAGTPRVHAHLFRHTFATNLLLQGVPLETVSQLLGHASTTITERSYRHWVKGRQEKLEGAVKIRGHNWARNSTSSYKTAKNPHKTWALIWWRRGELEYS
jgi:integrase